MPERRKPVEPERKLSPIARFRAQLIIDRDDLDTCLAEHAEIAEHVGTAHAEAVAERDACKLELEIAEADEAQKIREKAATMEEKLTEASLREQLTLSKRLQNLKKEQILLKKEIDELASLRDAFQQRGQMLARGLAPMWVARMAGRDSVSARGQMSDAIRANADAERAKIGTGRRNRDQ